MSLGKSTEIADISIWEILNELKERNITLDYKISDAEREMENILERYGK